MSQDSYVVVVGGANMDISGQPDAPLVRHDSNLGTVRLFPGGVGRNIAHNLALLGVDVRLVTAFGEDAQADALVESCTEAGVDVAHSFVVPDAATSTYLCVVDETGEMLVAINDMAILEYLTPERLEERAGLLEGAALVLADTNIPVASLRWLAEHVQAPLFCDPISTVKARKLEGILGSLCTLKPNRLEAEELSGMAITDEASLERAAQALLDTGLERAFVSLGAEGLLCADHERLERLPLPPCEPVNTTGAGDAMMAGLVWAHLQGLDLAEAGCAGMAAASIACESAQTVSPAMCEEALRARM